MAASEKLKKEFVINASEGFFHAMLSYRVDPDLSLVSKIHDKLHLLAPIADKGGNQLLDSSPFPVGFHRDESVLNSSLRVFQDVHCLSDGMGWEGDGGIKSGGFVGALRLSPVFVPLFSVNVDETGQLVHKGSVGQLLDLAGQDKQDNVLLELILARELHLLANANSLDRKKVLAPCSYILPLFLNKEIWKAASLLPKTASAITNAKALQVMKHMGVPDSAVSEELIIGTLTVQAVWGFFTQFQGIKMYECGKESFQVLAAAKAVLGVIDRVIDVVTDLKLDDMNSNSSQMHELSDFMSKQNMSNYTAILANHHITNVFQLAELKQSRADAIVQSIAEHGARVSAKSTVPNELSKIGSAIHAAQSSPLAKSLNDRFRNFIDHDASFVSILSSSSLFDIFLSKKLAVSLLFLFSSFWFIMSLNNLTSNSLYVSGLSGLVAQSFIPWSIVMLACLVSVIHSPRSGRYTLALATFVFAIFSIAQFAISAHSAIVENCMNCSIKIPSDLYSNLSIVQRILAQPTGFIPLVGLLFCILFKQQYAFSVVFVLQFIINSIVISSIIGWSVVLKLGNPFQNPAVWFIVFIVMKILQVIGNRRARSFYDLNSTKIDTKYDELCKKEENKQFKTLCTPAPHKSPSFWHYFRILSGPQRVAAANFTVSTESEIVSDQISASKENKCRKKSIEDVFKMENALLSEVLQRHHSFEDLIRDAEFINDAFQEWVSSWLCGGPNPDTIPKYLYHERSTKLRSSLEQIHTKIDQDVPNGTPVETLGESGMFSEVRFACGIDSPQVVKGWVKTEYLKPLDNAEPQSASVHTPSVPLPHVTHIIFRPLVESFRNLSSASPSISIKGECKRGPLKHVDRAIAKVGVICHFVHEHSGFSVFQYDFLTFIFAIAGGGCFSPQYHRRTVRIPKISTG